MPNWIEGVLKIRGDREHLLDFLNKGLDEMKIMGESKRDVVYYQYDDCIEVFIGNAHIAGSQRGFIENTNDCVYFDKGGNVASVIILDAKFAWDADVNALVVLSKNIGVDFRFYGFESGMEFNRDIEIIQGNITRNQKITFQDYNWECVDPKKGG